MQVVLLSNMLVVAQPILLGLLELLIMLFCWLVILQPIGLLKILGEQIGDIMVMDISTKIVIAILKLGLMLCKLVGLHLHLHLLLHLHQPLLQLEL